MLTMFIISYIANWVYIVYSLVTAPSDVELWDEEID